MLFSCNVDGSLLVVQDFAARCVLHVPDIGLGSQHMDVPHPVDVEGRHHLAAMTGSQFIQKIYPGDPEKFVASPGISDEPYSPRRSPFFGTIFQVESRIQKLTEK